MTNFGIIIPARFASTRLPGKPLRKIAGRPMVQWVVENAKKTGADFVWVATDDQRIFDAVVDFGGEAVMTSASHTTGTDRLAEVVQARNVSADTIVVNVQGDEPLLAPRYVKLVANSLAAHDEAGISTLASPITQPEELFSTNVVKVVTDEAGRACYFSRAPIPWVRDSFGAGVPKALPAEFTFLRHVGLYAYRARALQSLSQRPPAKIEMAESLEQLRALYAGVPLFVTTVDEAPAHGVDTEEDLAKVEALVGAELLNSGR